MLKVEPEVLHLSFLPHCQSQLLRDSKLFLNLKEAQIYFVFSSATWKLHEMAASTVILPTPFQQRLVQRRVSHVFPHRNSSLMGKFSLEESLASATSLTAQNRAYANTIMGCSQTSLIFAIFKVFKIVSCLLSVFRASPHLQNKNPFTKVYHPKHRENE